MTLERFIALPPLDDEKIEDIAGLSLEQINREISANSTVNEVVEHEISDHTSALAASRALQAKLRRRQQILIQAKQAIDGDLT